MTGSTNVVELNDLPTATPKFAPLATVLIVQIGMQHNHEAWPLSEGSLED